MSKFLEAPEAAQFPEHSEKLPELLDTLIIRQAADTIIARFKNEYGLYPLTEGENFVGSGFYAPEREVRKFFDMAKHSSNPLIISEAIRIVYEMDSAVIDAEKLNDWLNQRFEIDDHIEELFSTEAWQRYVDETDSQHAYGARTFSQYHREHLLRNSSMVKDLYQNRYEKLLEPTQPSIDEDGEEVKPRKISAHDIERIVPIAEKLDDPDVLIDLIALHSNGDINSSYSTPDRNGGYRRNIRTLIKRLAELQPERLQPWLDKIKKDWAEPDDFSVFSEHNTLLAINLAFRLKDWSTLLEILKEDSRDGLYQAYKLEFIAEALLDEKIQLPEEMRLEMRSFLIERINEMDVEGCLYILSVFQAPELLDKCVQTLLYELDQNHTDEDDFRTVQNYVLQNGTQAHREELQVFVRSRLTYQLEKLEAGKESEDRNDIYGDRAVLVSELGAATKDLQILEDLTEIMHPVLGTSTLGTRQAKEAILIAIPTLIEHGNPFIVQQLSEMGVDLYCFLEDVALTEGKGHDFFDLKYLADGIPIMLEIFRDLAQFHPELEMKNKNSDVMIIPSKVAQKVSNFYEWVSTGIFHEHEFFGQDYTVKSISESLDLARDLVRKKVDPEIVKKVKMVVLSEAMKLMARHEYTAAGFFIEVLYDSVEDEKADLQDLLPLLSKENLSWIVNMLFPEDTSSPVQYKN